MTDRDQQTTGWQPKKRYPRPPIEREVFRAEVAPDRRARVIACGEVTEDLLDSLTAYLDLLRRAAVKDQIDEAAERNEGPTSILIEPSVCRP